jgi:hypothetical protein
MKEDQEITSNQCRLIHSEVVIAPLQELTVRSHRRDPSRLGTPVASVLHGLQQAEVARRGRATHATR